jgi:serine/threonine-protein kinase ULK2
LALEYCKGGDLAMLLKRQPERKVSEAVALSLMRQLALGLKFMGHHNIMHRDLKPQNLLLTTDDPLTAVLKIADFGFARFMGSPSANAETLCGSPLYMAPEILRMRPYTSQADIWSVGVILYEMVTGTPPLMAPTPFELIRAMEEKEIAFSDPFFRSCTPACLHLIRHLLQKDLRSRISFEGFFTHPWLALTQHELLGMMLGLLSCFFFFFFFFF